MTFHIKDRLRCSSQRKRSFAFWALFRRHLSLNMPGISLPRQPVHR